MSSFPTATVADMRTEHLPALRRQIEIINEARTKGQPAVAYTHLTLPTTPYV